ncbi:predicted protein [Lichtheimia corymbifera JMRC:FSU:9682]|uniref:Uncharacterized protein n=1 Tax=Lichtheimia corymbifera JMRC:FSU:9682 TaxID=1263082 RepID=A0A068RZM3_9FUNG|nr:predicted protein [Lichtheimia corymbifera JMRC:FSU:9682]
MPSNSSNPSSSSAVSTCSSTRSRMHHSKLPHINKAAFIQWLSATHMKRPQATRDNGDLANGSCCYGMVVAEERVVVVE